MGPSTILVKRGTYHDYFSLLLFLSLSLLSLSLPLPLLILMIRHPLKRRGCHPPSAGGSGTILSLSAPIAQECHGQKNKAQGKSARGRRKGEGRQLEEGGNRKGKKRRGVGSPLFLLIRYLSSEGHLQNLSLQNFRTTSLLP